MGDFASDPEMEGLKKEGSRTTASVMLDKSPCSGLGRHPKMRARRHKTGQVGGGGRGEITGNERAPMAATVVGRNAGRTGFMR